MTKTHEQPPDPEQPPKEIEDKPALTLAWRGVVISIKEGQMSRRQGFEMLKKWEDEEHLHDTGPDGTPAA